MNDSTEDKPTTALGLLAAAGDLLPDRTDHDPTLFAELAFTLSAEGVYDGLDDHDGRHAAGVTIVDLINGGPERLCARAHWIASGEGGEPLHDPQAVAVALYRTAAVCDAR